MKIAVIGIGGVGGYFGGKAARRYVGQKGFEVTFIARGEHLKQIREKGLRQITDEASFTVAPDRATDDPSACGVFDLVLFCVKTYDLEESARLLKGNVDQRTIAISLLNGVDNGERLKTALPDAEVLNGCVYIGAQLVRPGVVRQAGGSCKLYFGPENGGSHNGLAIEGLLQDASIKAEYRTDIKTVVWEKYLFVSPLASATTYFGKPFGAFLEKGKDRTFLERLLNEAESAAREQEVILPGDIHERSLEKIKLFPYEAKSSMQMDFEKGKRTEIETFTGYIVRFARSRGIAAPLHEMVYEELIKRLNVA
jgi:2-dehydropantoate 2-reductase